MAPIYDTGNCLFYGEDSVPVKSGLLSIRVSSFCKKEANMLSYIKNKELLNIQKLQDFPKEAEKLLAEYTKVSKTRAEKIAETIEKKIEYLRLFQEGKKIWKREKYW